MKPSTTAAPAPAGRGSGIGISFARAGRAVVAIGVLLVLLTCILAPAARAEPSMANGMGDQTDGFVQVYSGGYHSMGIRANGTVWAWGHNGYGQLGIGDTTNRLGPVQITALTGARQISLGRFHSMAVLADGTTWAWGRNNSGQLGLGDTTDRLTPTQVALTGTRQLALGGDHSMAIHSNGTVRAWGRNDQGQLGLGDTTNRLGPTVVTALAGARQLAGGYLHSMAILSGGTVQSWGYNAQGQLGLSDTSRRLAPTTVTALAGARQVALGGYHSMAILSSGTTWVWGYNYHGQLGLNDTTNRTAPTQLALTGTRQFSLGMQHSTAIHSTGTVRAWGYNAYGQLGLADTTNRLVPTQITSLTGSRHLSAGWYHVTGLKATGTSWSWGYNPHGQLGLGDTSNRLSPEQNLFDSACGFVKVYTGVYHSMGIKADGTVWAWGWNFYGQLGDGTTIDRLVPTQITALTGVRQLSLGNGHSMAIKADGTVWAWGANGNGQLGDGTTTDQLVPIQVTALAGARQLILGTHHSMAIKANGTVWAWGWNYYGQLGLGDTTSRLIPTQITALTGARQLILGAHHSMAIKADGTVWVWGYNYYGQLGLGDTTGRLVPTQVTALTGARQLALGSYHSMAIKANGTVWAWGANGSGQLGDGTTTTRLIPTQITALTGARQLALGGSHSMAIEADGTGWAWGANGSGQLGDGTTTSRLIPTQITALTGARQLSLGTYHSTGIKSNGTVWSWGANGYGQLGLGDTTNRNTPTAVSAACAGNPPATPSNTAPANGAWVATTTPTLQSSAFSDPNGDGHLASHWQVRTSSGTYGSPAHNSGWKTADKVAHLVTTPLVDGTTYYFRVRHRDTAVPTRSSAWSTETSFTIDVSAPTAPTATSDGTGTDIDWQSSTSALSANWTAGSDTISGVRDYGYCFATATGCTGTVIASGYATTQAVTRSSLTLVEGAIYYACVRTRDNALNLSAYTCSDGVTVDATAPVAPSATLDGTGSDIDWQSSTSALSANWTAGSDTLSGVRDYGYCFATATGCGGTIIATGYATAQSVTRSSLTLTEGTVYYACVRTRDNALNLSAYTCSDGVTVDATAPVAPSATLDGTGSDIDWQADATSLSTNWTAGSDTLSGMLDYHYCFATATGCTGTVIASGYTTMQSVTRSSLTLTDGAIYYACVRTRDNALNLSTYTCSDGVTVDVTAPVAPSATSDGTGTDIDWQSSATALSANWTAGSDTVSGVRDYGYCFATATSCGGTVIATGYATLQSVTRSSLTLVEGTVYYACVRTRDNALNLSAYTCSDGVTVDVTVPVAPSATSDGTGSDIDWQNSTTALSANWTAGSDTLSGVRDYGYCFATATSCGGTVIATGYATLQSVTRSSLTLVEGTVYYACVRTRDNALNLSAYTCSDGVTVDATAPVAPSATSDGTGSDIDWQTSTTALSANWTAGSDTLSGLRDYHYCFATATACGGTVIATGYATLQSVTRSSLTLTDGAIYYACVRTRDVALNLSTYTCSDGVTVDVTAPTSPAPVNDGTGADIDAQASLTTLDANWATSSDATSGVAGYEYCAGTATGCTGTIAASGTTTSAAVSLTALQLDGGLTYYFCVTAIDNVGNRSSQACSDGVLVQGTLTLSLAGYETADLGLRAPGETSHTETRASVTTDNPTGYALALHDPDANGAAWNGSAALPWNTSGTTATPAAFTGTGIAVSMFGGSSTPARWCTGGQANCTAIDDPDLLWAQLSGTSEAVSGAAAAVTGDVTRIPMRMTIAATQAAGTYTGSITVTVTANP